MKKKTKIHNAGFLFSPTTHLFPLSGQLGSRGVSVKITLKSQIWNMEMIINQSILPCRLELRWIEKRWTKNKKLTQTQIPPGGIESIRKDLFFLLAAIYNISKLKLMHFGPCYLGSKGLQQARIKTQRWGKLPGSSGSSKSQKLGRVSFSFC